MPRSFVVYCLSFVAFTVVVPVALLVRVLLSWSGNPRDLSVWTGAPVINLAINARAERTLGARTCSIVNYTYFITKQFDIVLGNYFPGRWWLRVAPYFGFVWICFSASRLHAFCDGGMLPAYRRLSFNRLEMYAYRILRIPVFLWTYGADVRVQTMTKALGEPNCCTDCSAVKISCICEDNSWFANREFLVQHARAIFAMGDMVEYTQGSRNDLFFWPVDLEKEGGQHYRPEYPVQGEKPIRIIHAPNHRQFKGTKYLVAAVEELRREGVQIELVLVERIPNDQALEIYRTADIVFDQCLVGFHGYFAIEAMALGKPVMCYIRHPDKYLLDHEACPMINVHRDEIKEVLRRFATKEKVRLPDIGRQSRQYVEKYFTLSAFAGRLGRSYKELGVVL